MSLNNYKVSGNNRKASKMTHFKPQYMVIMQIQMLLLTNASASFRFIRDRKASEMYCLHVLLQAWPSISISEELDISTVQNTSKVPREMYNEQKRSASIINQ